MNIYEMQCAAALKHKSRAIYWVAHYQAMPALTDGQRTTLATYEREADVCQREYQRVKNMDTGRDRTERSRNARKAVAK